MAEKRFVSKDQSPRLYDNNILERMTRCHPALPFIVFIPVVAFLLYRAIFVVETPWYAIIGLWALALTFWTGLEYFIHRYILHYEPTTEFGKKLLYATHGVHHDYPEDTSRVVLPLTVTIPGAIGFYFLFKLILGPSLIDAYASGLVASYLLYDYCHYAAHHFSPKNKLMKIMKKHHLRHHFKDNTKDYGFTTTLWDKLFGTEL